MPSVADTVWIQMMEDRMSEPVGVCLEIGGKVRRSHIPELLTAVTTDIYDISDGPVSSAGFLKACRKSRRVVWYGTANYGDCSNAMAWLKEHGVGYILRTDSTYDTSASLEFWTPDMPEPKSVYSTASGEPLTCPEELSPLLKLMLDIIDKGRNQALALHMNDREDGQFDVRALVKKLMESPERKTASILADDIRRRMPALPKLPKVVVLPL
jgi:hypothetical protein